MVTLVAGFALGFFASRINWKGIVIWAKNLLSR